MNFEEFSKECPWNNIEYSPLTKGSICPSVNNFKEGCCEKNCALYKIAIKILNKEKSV